MNFIKRMNQKEETEWLKNKDNGTFEPGKENRMILSHVAAKQFLQIQSQLSPRGFTFTVVPVLDSDLT